jgi:hypothetical protein
VTARAEPLTRMGRAARRLDEQTGQTVHAAAFYDEAAHELWPVDHSVVDVANRAWELADEAGALGGTE